MVGHEVGVTHGGRLLTTNLLRQLSGSQNVSPTTVLFTFSFVVAGSLLPPTSAIAAPSAEEDPVVVHVALVCGIGGAVAVARAEADETDREVLGGASSRTAGHSARDCAVSYAAYCGLEGAGVGASAGGTNPDGGSSGGLASFMGAIRARFRVLLFIVLPSTSCRQKFPAVCCLRFRGEEVDLIARDDQ